MLIKNNFIYAKESRQLVSPTEAKVRIILIFMPRKPAIKIRFIYLGGEY